MKYVVVTGASSGIGRATAEDLIAHGYHVFGSLRKQSQADELQAKLGKQFTPLLLDVTDQAAISAAATQVAAVVGDEGLAGLVNNAGVAVPGPLMYQPMDQVRLHFEVHVFGPLAMIQTFLPLLGATIPQTRPPGRIVNVSSVGGKLTTPFLGAYTASKHAIESMSDALRRELNIFGIFVSVIEPGSIRTEIWEKADQQDDAAAYMHTPYGQIFAKVSKEYIARGRGGVSPKVVAEPIRHALESPKPKTRYALPDSYIFTWLLPRMLPDRWLDRILIGQMGLGRQT